MVRKRQHTPRQETPPTPNLPNIHTQHKLYPHNNNITRNVQKTDLFKVTPDRKLLLVNSKMTLILVKIILSITGDSTNKQIRLNYKLLAQKYNPDKSVDKCDFTKQEESKYFKNISNTYERLIKSVS